MKVTLVVASGAHLGKVIAITGPQFLIGRDAQCHLRPASQAISKHHCGVLVRDGKVYVKDFGSTNGTTVNNEIIRGAEVVVVDGASVKLGPLDFTVRIELLAPNPDGTPLPSTSSAAALAAVKAMASGPQKAPVRDVTPNPTEPRKPAKPAAAGGSKESPALTGSKEAAALKGSKESTGLTDSKEAGALKTPVAKPAITLGGASSEEDDKMAAMLMGMDDEHAEVPDGSTVVEMPAVDAMGNPLPPAAKPEEKVKKPVQTREDMTNAASDLLRKMMRRPK